ncbi:DMT family transporter [Geminicoccaceae bacterium 1502E]|nr:DMT family transporter [Geminicoccaceae bacterium 1502E]
MTLPLASRAAGPPAPLRGVLLMVAGVGLLTIMDACIKHLSARYPVPELVFFRCLFALPVLLLALHFDGGIQGLVRARHRWQLLRGCFSTATSLLFFYGLAALPLVDTLAISFSAPLLVALLAGPLLGERLDGRGWALVILGFAGVLVVLRPGMGVLQPGALLVVASTLTYALGMILLRRLGLTDSATVTTLYATLIPGTVALAVALPLWQTPEPADLPLMLASGILGACGTLAVSAAFRLAAAPLLTSLDYTAILWAAGLGWLVFDELPSIFVLLGAALVITSGLGISRRR